MFRIPCPYLRHSVAARILTKSGRHEPSHSISEGHDLKVMKLLAKRKILSFARKPKGCLPSSSALPMPEYEPMDGVTCSEYILASHNISWFRSVGGLDERYIEERISWQNSSHRGRSILWTSRESFEVASTKEIQWCLIHRPMRKHFWIFQ